MFNKIFEFINNLFPYKTYNSGKIYIVNRGKKTELKHKIKGLNVIFNKYGVNNTLELHLPLNFEKTTIYFNGSNAKMTFMRTPNPIVEATFYCSAHSEIFIDENSSITMPNLVVKANNNTRENPSKIIIGKNTQIGKDVIIRTSDGHSIFNIGENVPFNAPEDVIIGDNVWLGERVVVLKGSTIPSNTIVGSCALVNKKFAEENTILGGVPAKIIKRNVTWKRAPYGQYMRSIGTRLLMLDEKKVLIKKLKRRLINLFTKSFC